MLDCHHVISVTDGFEMSLGGCDDEESCIVKIFCAGGLPLFIFGLVTVFKFFGGRCCAPRIRRP